MMPPPRASPLRKAGYLALILGAIMVVCGCGAHGHTAMSPAAIPDSINSILMVSSRWGVARGCPVEEPYVLTAAHVIDPAPFAQDVPLYPIRWSDDQGHEGRLKPLWVEADADIAVMEFVGDTRPRWRFPIGVRRPAVGDEVFVLGYQRKKRDRAFWPDVVQTTVVQVGSGMLIVKDSAGPGSSGSCTVRRTDADGSVLELVAIASGWYGIGTSRLDSAEVGSAAGVWGDWIKPRLDARRESSRSQQ